MPTALDELSAQIPTKIATVQKLLKANDLPNPSFDESSAAEISGLPEEPQELLKARNELVNLAHDLLMLARGPVDHVVSLGYAAVDTADLSIITRFGVHSQVPLGGTISLDALSTATGLPKAQLIRTMRYAVMKGLFTEPEPESFGHSAASAALAKNKSLSDMTVFNSGFCNRMVASLSDALWARYGEKVPDAPEAAFNVAFPGYAGLFDYMDQSPKQSREYFNYLDGRARLPRYAVGNVNKLWRWDSVGSGTVIDCGGSTGYTAMALAKRLPNARLIVQDINVEGMKMGQELIAKDALLNDRITFMKHSFFEPQRTSADIYFFKHVLHDWSDQDCIKIIRALVPALKDGARILVMEGVLPRSSVGRTALLEDMQVLWDDRVMLAAHDAFERSIDEYAQLFKAADPGFSYVGAEGAIPGLHYTLMEYKYSKRLILN